MHGECSTPDGIDDRDGKQLKAHILRFLGAQRLTASMIATAVARSVKTTTKIS